jgi:CRP-like cAMP-binding protein
MTRDDQPCWTPQGKLNHRARLRVGFDAPVRIYSRGFSGPLAGRTRDLGVGGMCVATDSLVALDAIERVDLLLSDGALSLAVKGRWQAAVEEACFVLSGLEFVRPDPHAISRLWDVLAARGKELALFLYAGSDLSDLGAEEALGLAQVSRSRLAPRGATIYPRSGAAPGDSSIYIVEEGDVALEVRVGGVIPKVIDRLGKGRLFGGVALITDEPEAERALAESDVRLIEIDASAYRYLSATRPWLACHLATAVARAYGKRMRELLVRVRDLL